MFLTKIPSIQRHSVLYFWRSKTCWSSTNIPFLTYVWAKQCTFNKMIFILIEWGLREYVYEIESDFIIFIFVSHPYKRNMFCHINSKIYSSFVTYQTWLYSFNMRASHSDATADAFFWIEPKHASAYLRQWSALHWKWRWSLL